MKIKIASRTSKLAMKQVELFVKTFSIKNYSLKEVSTQGDKLSEDGNVLFDKANFVTDIETCLLDETADLAIHSAKDMPAMKTDGLEHIYFIEGKSRKISDLLIFKKGMEAMYKKNMKLGTSSLRRKMQAKYHLHSNDIHPLNGNIDTRLKKLDDGFYDCIILAEAGLSRLDYLLNDHKFIKLNHITCSGQGALSVQWKVGSKIEKFLKPFFANYSSDDLNLGINMERELLRKLEANCNSAISLNVSNGILNGEIYGKDKFITFSGKNVDEIFNNIRKGEGLRLLHEHY
ncbi:MAG: hydroxymethylbilane synthase [Gammaproteobacteria bacterium]|tara:strand:+ start:1268 stop:2134 length:867 start_codon:yes stop_codon:yes gene_type:complete